VLAIETNNVQLYRTALSHRSVKETADENNERLEYLGDAILSAIIADYLFKRYPYKEEGYLTEMRSKMVNRQQLNEIAVRMGLRKITFYNKFDNALKAALREDPDIILVGEMRDKETVNTALKAAQTGHLVMGTLHTNSAIKTLERILTLYSADEQPAMRTAIAESLVCIIAQGLCRTTDGKRAAFHDILINTETIKDYIHRGKYEDMAEIMKDGEYDGMITANQSLFNLYQEGRITEETALEMSAVPNELAMMLRGRV
jgi:type II secretory ATPase GspE/PulE/Tfp pilus assembly ATPase PilB-like protein